MKLEFSCLVSAALQTAADNACEASSTHQTTSLCTFSRVQAANFAPRPCRRSTAWSPEDLARLADESERSREEALGAAWSAQFNADLDGLFEYVNRGVVEWYSRVKAYQALDRQSQPVSGGRLLSFVRNACWRGLALARDIRGACNSLTVLSTVASITLACRFWLHLLERNRTAVQFRSWLPASVTLAFPAPPCA